MDIKQIEAAIKGYSKLLDERDIARLEFFKGLWELQERHAQMVAGLLEYDRPGIEAAEQQYWKEKPFFLSAPVPIDEKLFLAAINDCAGYLLENGDLNKEIAEDLKSFDWQKLVSSTDIKQAGCDPLAYREACAAYVEHEMGAALNADTVRLVIAYAVRPMIQGAAQSIMDSLSDALREGNNIHDKPVWCPACGGEAAASFVGETPSHQGNGRLLYCATCGTQWEFERIRCAHCGTQSQGHLHYFHLEGDEAHRLHNCQECGDYMRTAFSDDLKAPFCFEVEDVVMARLDMVAHDPRFSEEVTS